MNILDIDEACKIYQCSVGTKVKVHSVPSPNLQIFYRNIGQLFSTLSEEAKDDFWVQIVHELKRFRFDISAAPLSAKLISERETQLSRFLKSKAGFCNQVYSTEQGSMLKALANQLDQLGTLKELNLLDYLLSLGTEKKFLDSAFAVPESRLIPSVEESIAGISSLKAMEVIGPENLRDSRCYSKLFLFGSPRWFPEFVFSSPRAKELHVIKYKWISGKWEPENVLVAPYKFSGMKNRMLSIKDEPLDPDGFIQDDLLVRIDIQKIQEKANEQLIDLINDDNEVVNSRLFVLENDWFVFLDADDNASVDIIDLEEEAKKRVRRAQVKELQPGMFILLRTEGGGDYIVPVADKIMGSFKDKARSDQKKWKLLLRDEVKRKGSTAVIEQLLKLGSERAALLNLHHWMSFRGIKTGHYDDFLAIMKLVGLEKEAKDYWDTMDRIRAAHTKAGFTIRSMLLELVNKSDLNKLKRQGKMDFELAGQGAGKLSAFRVKDISPTTTEVIHWRIGEPFRVEK